MNDEDINFFPRYIDSPPIIGIFELDEFFVFFGSIIASVLVSIIFPDLSSGIVMIFAFILGVVLTSAYKKFKSNRPNGQTWHYFYKKGIFHPLDKKTVLIKYPYLAKIKSIPYGFIKTFYN